MSKVYIVTESPAHQTVGVYHTREAAEGAVREMGEHPQGEYWQIQQMECSGPEQRDVECAAVIIDCFSRALALPEFYSDAAVRIVIDRISSPAYTIEPEERAVVDAFLVLLRSK